MQCNSIKKVTVIGAGLMGHGIGLEFAAHGLGVRLVDRDQAASDAAKKRIDLGLDLLTEAGMLKADQHDEVRERISFSTDVTAASADADLVLEAVFENLKLKRSLLALAASSAPQHTIFASNTSSFMPSQLADATGRPHRFAVAHYFNPPHLMPLVEIVPAPGADPDVSDSLRTLYTDMGKKPVVIKKELPGFIANRLQGALSREAAALVQQGIATPRDVDSVIKYGFGRRLAIAGPFEIWEQAGWDLVSTIVGELFTEIDISSGPSQMMLEAVDRGDFGVKTGRGMYEWAPESAEALRLRIGRALIRLAQLEAGTAEAESAGNRTLQTDQRPEPRETGMPVIAVVGAGLMGHGIALEFAAHGHEVAINDISEDLLGSALQRCETGLKLLAKTGRIAEETVPEALGRLTASADLRSTVENADIVIEATSENLELKQRIFSELDVYCKPDAVLLSNTSTFLPSAIGKNTGRGKNVAVAHYFNPPHLLPVVEVVRGPETSDETIAIVVELFKSIGKKPAVVQREIQGFIGNRLQSAVFREALHIVSAGVATAPEIDEVVRSSFGRRLSVAGTFELRDIVGLDLALDISRQVLPSLDNSKTIPEVLAEKVRSGDLGTKTGKGFYEWTPESAEALRLRIANALADMASWPED